MNQYLIAVSIICLKYIKNKENDAVVPLIKSLHNFVDIMEQFLEREPIIFDQCKFSNTYNSKIHFQVHNLSSLLHSYRISLEEKSLMNGFSKSLVECIKSVKAYLLMGPELEEKLRSLLIKKEEQSQQQGLYFIKLKRTVTSDNFVVPKKSFSVERVSRDEEDFFYDPNYLELQKQVQEINFNRVF